MPAVTKPSPQLIAAVKLPAVSLRLVSVNVATVVLLATAVPSVAELNVTCPASCADTLAVLVAVAVPGASSVNVTVTVSVPGLA